MDTAGQNALKRFLAQSDSYLRFSYFWSPPGRALMPLVVALAFAVRSFCRYGRYALWRWLGLFSIRS
ncbi:hypothetical protein AAH446_10975 [Erwinia sp. P6884]|uniref:hypothetical protein n=1 Tax=Erwinia sp. P6884 TaxID=3141450 RepID=UPI00319B9230